MERVDQWVRTHFGGSPAVPTTSVDFPSDDDSESLPSPEELLRSLQQQQQSSSSSLPSTIPQPMDAEEECPICLDVMGLTSRRTTTPCNHQFHRDCIEKWWIKDWTCPLCRKELFPYYDSSSSSSLPSTIPWPMDAEEECMSNMSRRHGSYVETNNDAFLPPVSQGLY